MKSKSVHTTIPEKYHNYATKNHLKFSELLIKAIENEMTHDPNAIQEELQEIEEKKEQLLKKLKTTQKKDEDKKGRIKAMHEGLMPA